MITRRLTHLLLVLSLIILIPACSSVDKTTNPYKQKEVILERDQVVSNQCQSFTPANSIEESFFEEQSPKLYAITNQDTLKLSEYKLSKPEFSDVNNVSFYAHYNSDGKIQKVEASGDYNSVSQNTLKEIAESFIIIFPNNDECRGTGMISGYL